MHISKSKQNLRLKNYFGCPPRQYWREGYKTSSLPQYLSTQKKNTVTQFYIHGFVHRDSILIRSNKMQQYAGIYLLQIYSTCFGCPSNPSSGVHETVIAASGTGHSIWAATFLQRGHVGGMLLLRYYDMYQRMQLQLYLLLMMGAMDTRNM